MILYIIVSVFARTHESRLLDNMGWGGGGAGRGKVEGESAGRDIWNWGTFSGQYGNLAQCKLPGIYESDPSEDS